MNTKVAILRYVLCFSLVWLMHSLLIGVKHSQQLPQPITPPCQPLQPLSPRPLWQRLVFPALPSGHSGLSQHWAVPSSGHCVHHEHPSKSQDTEHDQQESHTTVTMSIQIDKGFHCTRWVIPAAVGRNEVDVDKVQGAEGLEKMCWPSVCAQHQPIRHISVLTVSDPETGPE